MKIAAIVIDDDIDSRDILCSYIKENCPEIAIAGEAATVKETLALLATVKPDLLFLDIELPDGTAFDLLENISEKDFEVIFITAFDQYAVRAFKMAAIDYLLKPIANTVLEDAVIRVVSRIQEKHFSRHWEAFLHNSGQNNNTKKRLAITTSDGFLFVGLDEIVRLESHSNYTHFYFTNKSKLVSSRTLGYYEDILPKENFMRVHHAYIVNSGHIEKYIRSGGGGILVMCDGVQLPVSQRKKKDTLDYLLKLRGFEK
jgi:two-component system, LytTR family, response regulator